MRTERNPAIDLLRVLCILYVVGYWHLIPYTDWLPGYANAATEAIKDIALGTFVFSSGLLLARRDVRLRTAELGDFYRRRVLRIYPLYLLALLLFGGIGLATPDVVVRGALLISMFDPPAPPTLWFVTMIMFFYLLAPLLIAAARQPWRFGAVGAALYAGCLAYDAGWQPVDNRLLLFFPAFMLGVYAQRNAQARAFLTQRRRLLALLVVPAFALGLPGSAGFDTLTSVLRAPLAALGAALCVSGAEQLNGRLHGRIVPALSYASFGVYLFHRPVFEAAMAVYFPAQGWAQALYLAAIAVPASFLTAYAVQRLYDGALTRCTAAATAH